MAAVMGAVGRLVPLPPDLSAERLRVLSGVTYYGRSAKAQRELGFAARPLEDGLEDTLAWKRRLLRGA
jgi:nucleoside-diphosphate-sugar epimerase